MDARGGRQIRPDKTLLVLSNLRCVLDGVTDLGCRWIDGRASVNVVSIFNGPKLYDDVYL